MTTIRFLFNIPASFWRYLVVGGFNTLFNLALLNCLIWLTGVTSGLILVLLSLLAFFATLAQSYVWNRYWVFRHASTLNKYREFGAFGGIAIGIALIGNGLLYAGTTWMSPPFGIHPHLWVNIIIFLLIPLSFLGNYFGNRWLVFKK